MRRLALLALMTLAVLPLSAHGRWRAPRRVVVVAPRTFDRDWDDDRWACRERGWYRDECEAPRVVLRPWPRPRPLVPPFRGRVEVWLR